MLAVRRCTQKLIAMASSPLRVSAFSTASPGHGVKRVGTHDGRFHCDEALGCFMIRLTDKFAGAEIVRTTDMKVLDTLDAVLDFGYVYDPEHDRYDHEYRGFKEVFGHGFTTKLSTAGLVYKHYGLEILAKEIQLDPGHPDVHRLFIAVYKSFIEEIDAFDNEMNEGEDDEDDELMYGEVDVDVSLFHPYREEPDWFSPKQDEAFNRAMTLAGSEFLQNVRFHAGMTF